MAELNERIDNGLNEGRMLLLGGQVMLGFTYDVCFEPAFAKMPSPAQIAQIIGIVLMTAGLGWLISPAAFHQIAEGGQSTPAIEKFTSTILDWGLLPFALGLGLSLYPVSTVLDAAHPLLIAIAGGGFALVVWYAWTLLSRNRNKPSGRGSASSGDLARSNQVGESDISSRIKFVLVECRMALPGAQAFLGFQFVIIFTEAFGKLEPLMKWIHFASLLSTIVAIVLLIAPAAYHRIAEGGENTEHFHGVASKLLVVALIFLGPGMTGDLLLVLYMLSQSVILSASIAALLLLGFYGMWFGTSVRRLKERRLAEAI